MTVKFRLGEWTVDPALCQLEKDGRPFRVRAKVMDVLVYFAARPGVVISKDALLDGVWGTEAISESALTRTITELRQALDDSVESPRILETIPKRGYRLIAPVHPALSAPIGGTSQGTDQDAPIRTKRGRVWLAASMALATLLLLLTGYWLEASIWHVTPVRTPGSEIRTVVVLPLKNLTGDAGQDYFVDGMTEALTAALSQITVLRVISSTSAMHYRNAAKPAPEIARELGGLDALVEGSVLKSNNHLQVTVALIQATTDRRLWTGTYQHDVADVFALYNDVARVVAEEISVVVSRSDQERLAKSRAVRPEAYDAYVRGNQLMRHWMDGGCTKAEPYLVQAIELDRTFALPYADLAWCSVVPDRLQRPVAEIGPRARAYATEAIALDPFMSRAYGVLGVASSRLDFEWTAAEPLIKRALELDHSNPQAYIQYGEYLIAQGRWDEAIRYSEMSTKLDPLSPDRNVAFGFALMSVRHYDAAIEQFNKTLKMEPGYSTARYWLAETYARKGSRDAAVTAYLKWLEEVLVPKRAAAAVQNLMHTYTVAGWDTFWRTETTLAEEEASAPGTVWKPPYNRYCGPFFMARRYARIGDRERALQSLENAYQARHHQMPFIKIDPVFDALHEDSRFRDLLRRVGVSQ